MQWITLSDILSDSLHYLLLVGFAALFVWLTWRAVRDEPPEGTINAPSKQGRILNRIHLGMAGLMLLATSYAGFLRTYAIIAYHRGDYELRQGPIEAFVLEAWKGQGSEVFTVAGYRFDRHDSLVRSDSQNRILAPGCLHEGALVRVAHRGDLILKLELAVPSGDLPACLDGK